MSVGLYTYRGRLLDLALRRLKAPKPDPAETLLALRIGSECLAEDVTRGEATALVAQHAGEALSALLARGAGYPTSLVVCSTVSVCIDSLDGHVTQIIAREARDGSMQVQVTFGDRTQEVLALRRRATDR